MKVQEGEEGETPLLRAGVSAFAEGLDRGHLHARWWDVAQSMQLALLIQPLTSSKCSAPQPFRCSAWPGSPFLPSSRYCSLSHYSSFPFHFLWPPHNYHY